jgi:hypothetical protein
MHWRVHGAKVLDVMSMVEKQSAGLLQRYGVSSEAGAFDRSMTPDEAMERLERRVGPEGRKLFAAL